jgi:hypothetical protein
MMLALPAITNDEGRMTKRPAPRAMRARFSSIGRGKPLLQGAL